MYTSIHLRSTPSYSRVYSVMLILAASFLYMSYPTSLQAAEPTFENVLNFGPGQATTRTLAFGDLNGDGYLDVISGSYQQNSIVYLNNGDRDRNGHWDRTFTPAPIDTGNASTLAVALGDMDGDGDLDILTGNERQPNRIYLTGLRPDAT